MGPVRGEQNTESRRSFRIAPKRSRSLSMIIGRVLKRWRSEITSSGCTAAAAHRTVDTARSDPTINMHLANRIGRRSGALCRPPAHTPATAMRRRRPCSSLRSTSRLSAHLSHKLDMGVSPTPKASPGTCGLLCPAFVMINDGYSRQGAFTALNLEYSSKLSVLGAKNCSHVLSQAPAQPHRVRARCTLHRHVSMLLLKRSCESHVTRIRSQGARPGRTRSDADIGFKQNPGAGKGLSS